MVYSELRNGVYSWFCSLLLREWFSIFLFVHIMLYRTLRFICGATPPSPTIVTRPMPATTIPHRRHLRRRHHHRPMGRLPAVGVGARQRRHRRQHHRALGRRVLTQQPLWLQPSIHSFSRRRQNWPGRFGSIIEKQLQFITFTSKARWVICMYINCRLV